MSPTLLGAALFVILTITLFPYDFRSEAPPRLYSDTRAEASAPAPGRDFVANILLFVPLGVALSGLAMVGSASIVTRIAFSLCVSALLSLSIEGAQLLLPSRVPALRDVVANTAGGLLGSLGFAARGRAISRQWEQIVDGVARALQITRPGLALGVYLPLVLLAAGLLQAETRLSNWADGFPLVLGNEATGDRSWAGQIDQLEIADRALRPREAASGASLVHLPQGSIVASYQFDDGPQPGPGIASPPLTWRGHGRDGRAAAPDRRLLLRHDRWLESEAAGREISRALRRTNQLTVYLVCLPASPVQHGPARIVSISSDPHHRNLTIGQEGEAMVVRLRTPLTGANGGEPELAVPNVFGTGTARSLVLTYDGATLTAWLEGRGKAHRLNFTPGAVLARALLRPDPLELTGYWVIFVGLALGPAGFLLASLVRRSCAAPLPGLMALVTSSVVVSSALEAVLTTVSGRFVEPGNVLLGTACCLGGAWLAPRGPRTGAGDTASSPQATNTSA